MPSKYTTKLKPYLLLFASNALRFLYFILLVFALTFLSFLIQNRQFGISTELVIKGIPLYLGLFSWYFYLPVWIIFRALQLFFALLFRLRTLATDIILFIASPIIYFSLPLEYMQEVWFYFIIWDPIFSFAFIYVLVYIYFYKIRPRRHLQGQNPPVDPNTNNEN